MRPIQKFLAGHAQDVSVPLVELQKVRTDGGVDGFSGFDGVRGEPFQAIPVRHQNIPEGTGRNSHVRGLSEASDEVRVVYVQHIQMIGCQHDHNAEPFGSGHASVFPSELPAPVFVFFGEFDPGPFAGIPGVCNMGTSKNSSHEVSAESFPSYFTKFLRVGSTTRAEFCCV